MIGLCNCPIKSDHTIRLQLCRLIRENTAVFASVTFEEIIIVMINNKFRSLGNTDY